MIKSIALGIAALFGCGGEAGAASISSTAAEAIAALEQRVVALPGPATKSGTATLAERMAEARVPGVSVAFIEGGKVKWARAYGEKLAGSGRPVDTDTLFQAASLSKAVAAATALRMVDQRRLSLDENILPRVSGWQLPPGSTAVTLRQLLSHTAGLTVSGYPGYPVGSPVPDLAGSLAGKAPANTPQVRSFAAPGAQMAYSGGGYSVAQLLMIEAADRPFPALSNELLLRPAGMTRSFFGQPLPAARREGAASAHDADGQAVPGGSHIYPELAAAGLWTTPSDYGRFLIALQNAWAGRRNALLSIETARTMMTPVIGSYGLGVNAAGPGGRWFITHGGSNEGFQCRFAAFLDGTGQGLVIMTNGEGGGRLAAAIQRTLSQHYRWPEVRIPPQARAPR